MEKKVRHNADHRVHFDSAMGSCEKNNDIILNKINDDKIEINVGFLQLNHKYKIAFPVSRDLLKIERSSHLMPFDESLVPNISCHANNIIHDDDAIKFEVDYETHRDQKINEVLKYKLSNSDRVVSFILTSRVLGIGKGTPLLKNGVRCTGVISDDDSETSDLLGND